jgi:hypothetical protein
MVTYLCEGSHIVEVVTNVIMAMYGGGIGNF